MKKNKTIKFLEEHIDANLLHVGLASGFLETTLKAQVKENIGKLYYIKIKIFGASQDTSKKVKRQPTE